MNSAEVLPRCPKAENALADLYARVWNPRNEANQPQDLFHYTSAQGLCGILTAKVFQASDVFCLNDPSEFQYGKSLLMEVLSPKNDDVSSSLLSGFGSEDLFPHLGRNWGIYATCFCGVPDLLGQWRGYSGSGGYALGINLQKVLRDARSTKTFTVLRMLYDREQQLQVLNDLVSGSIAIFDQFKRPENQDALLNAIAADVILPAIFHLKHPAFRGEDEWRILMIESDANDKFPVKHRNAGVRLVPYIELPFAADWVNRVHIGPTVPTDNEYAVKRLLSTSGFSADVSLSDIPLRP